MAGISPYGRGCFSTSLRSYGKAFRFSSSLSSQSRRPAREQSSLLAHLHTRKKAVLRRTLFSTCGDAGNRSLSWIFYFWFAKLTIIKYLTPLTSTRALGLSSGFARPRFESSSQNKKLGTRWIFGHK